MPSPNEKYKKSEKDDYLKGEVKWQFLERWRDPYEPRWAIWFKVVSLIFILLSLNQIFNSSKEFHLGWFLFYTLHGSAVMVIHHFAISRWERRKRE